MDTAEKTLQEKVAVIKQGGAERYHLKAKEQGKLFARDRIRLLLDAESWSEDGLLANNLAEEPLPADGVITVVGQLHGRTVCVMANDSTVKAGSWGARTVEKILRIQETALRLQIPLFYLVDSAGARITDQIAMFPGRRGAGKIFANQVKLSGVVPQICLLFGPSAAGGAYIPAFCDLVIMVEKNASMYLGSPRMAEMVIGEKVSLEEMGGARMHCTVSGCGDVLCQTEEEAIQVAQRYFDFFPQNFRETPALVPAQAPESLATSIEELIPENINQPFDMYLFLRKLIDAGSFVEIKRLFAPELITGLARLGGRAIGIIANQPKVKGGVMFTDTADKGTRFIWLCDAFNIPLLFLADVPGFMIGSQVERTGIIRHGAKMISAVTEATVPKISVIIRKAYGAGLYAMCGPAFEPDCCLALPTASIAVMGAEAAVNAVFYNKIQELPLSERQAFINEKRQEYRQDIDIYRLASELIVDEVIAGSQLREELIRRYALYQSRVSSLPPKKHSVPPV